MDALRGWLVSVMAWFCTVLDRIPDDWRDAPFVRGFIAASKASIARSLRVCATNLRRIVVWHAIARMDYNHRRREQLGYEAAAHRRPSAMRLFTRMLPGFHRGSLRERVARLAAAVKNFDLLVKRALKRLLDLWRNPRPPALVTEFERVDALAKSATRVFSATDTS